MPLALLLLALIFAVAAVPAADAQGRTVKDSDWSTGLYDNCGLPVAAGPDRSVAWVRLDGDKKLRVRLRPGDKGGCGTDNQMRNGAPYWERAELRQEGFLRLGRLYWMSFEAIFEQGFVGDREAFFQIHGHNGTCDAYPPVMVTFQDGRLMVSALHKVSGNGLGNGKGQHRAVQSGTVRVQRLYGRAAQFVVEFDTRTTPARLSMSLNGDRIVTGAAVQYAPCAKPYVKFGIYRPGGKGSATSSVIFDDIRIEVVQ
jgi:hypothetical protein